jgi:class 3 adenylate cyclase/tetratricopeptide (TPR) repeat protein
VRELRKTVTAVFCDLAGSTALGESIDPEVLRGLLARYFERMRTIVERHGGTVEKFIGDAVVAVFGVPVVREDDALRACRAAVEMREALPGLGLRGRIGVNTGVVVTTTDETLATGDAMNVAARFEQAAEPGEVLIGAATYALVAAAVDAETVQPLELKGKAEPVPAFRLLNVLDVPERSHASRFVGREQELRWLTDTWERTRAETRCELVTVVGEAGLGKSRLVAEALDRMEARVVRGRCLPYGDGITYWPVVEVVKQLAVLPSDPLAAGAIRSLLGESDVATRGDEIAWAFRKLLEEQAPLVVVFDDIQWGEETFLDLVESTALLAGGAALLLVCIARTELAERRPGWPGMVQLEPLPAEQADALIGAAVSDELRARIARAAGGNPLFISEMLAMAAEDARVNVPPTLKALLAARLDQLDVAERRVLERGSVEGEIFHRGGVQALAPDEAEVTTRLAALVRRQLVRPHRAQIAGDDGYRFRHLLIRDAAYDALPKAVRADLHARFAGWLGEHGHALVERDEVVGYHLEQAACYLGELGQPNADIAERAALRLAAAGRRAGDRQDYQAALALLLRAVELLGPLRLDLALELEAAWYRLVVDGLAAAEAAHAIAGRAETASDRSGAMLARATALYLRVYGGDRAAGIAEAEELCRAALPPEKARGDPRRIRLVWRLLGSCANGRMQNDEAAEAAEQELRYARLAGDSPSDTTGLDLALILGPRPADEALQAFEEISEGLPPGASDLGRATLLAMVGRIDEAWPIAQARYEHLREVSGDSSAGAYLGLIAMMDGDRERACRHTVELIEEAPPGSDGVMASWKSMLARDLYYLGRIDEVEPLLDAARTSGWHPVERTLVPAVEALLLSSAGAHDRAEERARAAVATAETETDNVWLQGWSNEDLALVLERAGRMDEAREALKRALTVWERKRCLPYTRRVREQIESLGEAHV